MNKSSDRVVVRPSVLYIFLGAIFIFVMTLFLSSCTRAKDDPQPALTITSISPSEAAIGATITITGTNFDEVSSNNIVLFNDTPGFISSSSKTSMAVIVPEGATSGTVSVKVNGKLATSPKSFTVLE